ncbi:Type 1 glutamine amidotransferase-like domain-containing protein [Flammeovirga yaeyamensis]|uniref:Type 1 glutamine amidotransferase-like domain-containing protein n=1 Tax=Flammeovirga yaeyamensis TaxID=367791 RepID=A0AAX1NEA4_9BACT|nr:cyanophycinase [Flammeovirga yaeyamensis]MBB3699470.1 cyanophycinase [Flammeovirga yaeyamensis]NMF35273.1 cyanophycinase [Flammeovirga yaeyamensis]QWG04133.1 Type 1 glutamine amidotransferase-like domain-containing protein [Flammeovirga yaeyamensis]
MRQNYYLLLAVLVSSLFSSCLFAQNSPLLLVGGGSEENGGWSDEPYQWFVDQSMNKKIAIISYAEVESDWLSNYFISLGAEEAKDFKIDRTGAEDTQLIAELEAYDGFFFKGGDQNRYYNFYNNTAFKSLLLEKIDKGAVLGGTSAGMAILSSIVYTADNGSLYPEDGLSSMDARYFTFADDFLNVLPNTMVDTHFAERGRMPRLVSMLAYWNIHQPNQNVLGIGVDDRTALCIDENRIGTVHGTGAVTFIELNSSHNIDKSHPLQLSNTSLISCVNGQQFDINKKEKTSTDSIDKLYNSNISSSNVTLYNGANYLSILEGLTSKTLLVYDGIKTTVDKTSDDQLLVLDIRNFPSSNLEDFRTQLMATKEVVLLPIDSSLLDDFKEENSVLHLVWNAMKSSETKVHVFDEAIPFVGEKYASNVYSKDNAAYTGTLSYREGLGLLEKAMIMTDLFSNSDYNENTTAVFQEALFSQDINWCVGLTDKSELQFEVIDNQWNLTYTGEKSSIITENYSDAYTTADSKRAIAGFQDVRTHVMYNNTISLQEVNFQNYEPTFDDIISSLPSSDTSSILWKHNQLFFQHRANRNIQLIDLQGMVHLNITTDQEIVDFPIQSVSPMIIRVTNLSSRGQTTLKIQSTK